jgi:hypothetical protein
VLFKLFENLAWSFHNRTENSNQKENSFKSKNVRKQNKTLINQHEEKSIYSKQEIVGEKIFETEKLSAVCLILLIILLN